MGIKFLAPERSLNSYSILTFVVEPVDPVNTGTFVVAPEEEEVLRVLDLVGEQEAAGRGLFIS